MAAIPKSRSQPEQQPYGDQPSRQIRKRLSQQPVHKTVNLAHIRYIAGGDSAQIVFSQSLHGAVQGINVLKSAYGKNAAINDNRITTDYFLQDATFFKIDAISLGYTLDLSKWQKYVSSARFYVTARDVATFTRYKGYNPEQNVNGLFPGLAGFQDVRSMYPQTIRWTFGMQLKF